VEQLEKAFRWYILECPVIGIKELNDARQRAVKLKAKFGSRAQIIIISETNGQYISCSADDLLGITVLQGASATECEAPSIVFAKKGKNPVFYSRAQDLGCGHFPSRRP